MNNSSQDTPGLFDGVKFWARLFLEIMAIIFGSLFLFFIARPIAEYLFGSGGQGFTFSWFLLTFLILMWYRKRRPQVGY